VNLNGVGSFVKLDLEGVQGSAGGVVRDVGVSNNEAALTVHRGSAVGDRAGGRIQITTPSGNQVADR
jgi:hypothetical protein